MIWLQGHGVSPRLAAKIYEAYGAQTIALVQADPYRLERDISGVGFETADRIAQALGVLHGAPARVMAGMSYVLEVAGQEGHVYLPFGQLVGRAANLLGVARLRQRDVDAAPAGGGRAGRGVYPCPRRAART